MKKLTFLVYVLLFTNIAVNSQSPCLPQGITFTTQAQIDNFQTNYPGCTEIEGNVLIQGQNITNLNGLIVVTSIGGYLSIYNSALNSLTGLESLSTIGGYLGIYYNETLTSLSGLESLNNIYGDCIIVGNFLLSTLEGFNNLNSIGGSLVIGFYDGWISWGNPSLVSLSGLESLTFIEEGLNIELNPVLTSLSRLENIKANSIDDLDICNNYVLSECDVQSICDYLASPNGTIYIYNNAPGCNSPVEVEEACDSITSVAEHENDSELVIAPNPVSDFAEISLNLSGNLQVEICLYNITDICVKSWQYPLSSI